MMLTDIQSCMRKAVEEVGAAIQSGDNDMMRVYCQTIWELSQIHVTPLDLPRLHDLVRQSGLTQTEIGEAIKRSQSSVSNILAGQQPATFGDVLNFAGLFKVPSLLLIPGGLDPIRQADGVYDLSPHVRELFAHAIALENEGRREDAESALAQAVLLEEVERLVDGER